MFDFTPLRAGKATIAELAERLDRDDLRRLTQEMIDAMRSLIAGSIDADVVFVPEDLLAHDPYAANETDVARSWTLGHVIVHVTASAEEAAVLAVELARGVGPRRARSRYEVPWESITTVGQCVQRLEESRRMRLASLEMWPDQPHLDNTVEFGQYGPLNAVTRFLLGLKHDDDHLDQIANIVRQAQAARAGVAV